MTATAPPDLPGLDLARLGDWFAAAVPGAARLTTARLVTGGKSNLTYEVGDGRSTWIVRRPPLGHVLSTAHDMAREYRVMSALRATSVPVPVTWALCADDGVLGAPFYVMERVTGRAYRHAAELEPLGTDRTRAISTRLVDTLATLHAVDPAAVGLADFGRPAGFLARQVRRWKTQLDASYCRDLPAADELHARLAAGVPADSAPGIVHGDYRLDNVLVDESDRLTAVVDWEMATLGDPLTDLALLVLYQRLGRLVGPAVAEASSAPGFLTEDEILDRYAAASGRALPPLGFHLGLAAFKLATILEGIHVRHLRGQTVGAGFDQLGEVTELLLDAGLTYLKEH
ncbi:phosphotransferase family protein [Micromonospora chaiyaphumensis]|uniref:Predicted kinase, aminoglycoside phosphotransferase (APT) family n=1 Tax=Micromonospora chaiyaphumensis TaxID=307119 RepID=A0A1C4U7V2_9ACTN|nr:phosphotransferase family protein [Micromonospora chaiyaphumensis]SCE67689.1 Predicted kinase, aminoglycoside phosphotransferase (APT) family [Micromonospora chaiyaphumensis]